MATDLISRETALKALEEVKVYVSEICFGKIILKEYTSQVREGCIDILRNIPKEDAEFIYHGGWITIGKSNKGSIIRKCSYCGTERTNISKSKYCRDCGALMDLPDTIMGQQSFYI